MVELEIEEEVEQKEDKVLDHAMYYCVNNNYPGGLPTDRKRALRKKAKPIIFEKGEFFWYQKREKANTAIQIVHQI